MSFKLDQKPIAGESYVRCSQVVIDNRLGIVPTVTFQRETVIGIEGGAVMRQPMSPREMALDISALFPVINPETGEATGQTVTHGEIYALIYSAFVAIETAPTEAPAQEGGV